MSTNNITIKDLELEFPDEKIKLKWKCPRCQTKQFVEIEIADIYSTVHAIECCMEGCGKGNMWFEFDLQVIGSYIGQNDEPIKWQLMEKNKV